MNPDSNKAAKQWAILLIVFTSVIVVLAALIWWRWSRRPQEQAAVPEPARAVQTLEQPTATQAMAELPATTAMAPRVNSGYGGSCFYAGAPRRTSYANILIVLTNAGYTVGYDDLRQTPAWTCYRLFRVANLKPGPRTGQFRIDGRTTSRVSSSDYNGSGFDRGHCAPDLAIALCYGEQAREETYLMSNILPEVPKLNRGLWKGLEAREIRQWAQEFEEIWIITGGVAGSAKLSGSGITVPDALYKIIVDEEQGQPRALAFIIPQEVTGDEHLGQFLVSVDSVEAQTGLDFMSALDDALENRIENARTGPVW